jgi:magnesium chelatase family protein
MIVMGELALDGTITGVNSVLAAAIGAVAKQMGLIVSRPYRDPHHSSSVAALVGGGVRAKPVEVSLAHGGVLFLDELAEWPAHQLDALRQTIETGKVVVS